MDPAGDGGGGPTSIASTDDNVTPVTPSTGIAGSPGSHHQQHPPPSPLSGCYLLVVLPEPHTAQHRDLILNRLAKGFLSWDKDSCHVDLEKELQALVAQAPEGEEARNGERLIQYATENLVTEVLIHPQTNTLLQCIRNLLASFTKHRHIIHAGYTFSGNGSWILQDGTFSLADFLDAISEHEVQRVLRAYENSVTVDINCAGVGEWSTTRLLKEACTRFCRVRLNPDDVLTAGVPAISSFTNYVGQYLVSQTLDQLMEPSDVVGNIRFSHPTLYVFPGGQGDAALFGINGFNMLVDGGFARKACFWDFARHLDRLDAVLITRINNSNVGGMSSVLRKKREMHVYPQIGHFFCNLIERRLSNSPDGDKDLDPLILSLTDIGQDMMVDLRHINLRAHPCYRDPNPINLYHKVGHGTLDMYVLSPSKDSREVKEFLTKWHASDAKLFAGSYRKDSNNLTFPIQNLASICALLVWQPANPEDTITRILFPGSTPQHKIFEGIERLKHLEFLKHSVCTAKSLSPSNSLMALKDKPIIKQKLGLLEESKKSPDRKKDKRDLPESKLSKYTEDLGSKPASQPVPPVQTPKVQPPKIDVKMKKVIENKKIEKDLKEMKKESIKKDSPKIEKDTEIRKLDGYKIRMDNEKTAIIKESKHKSEPKKKETKEARPIKMIKGEPVSKAFPKLSDKKQKLQADKKDQTKASPPTPKKIMNGSASKVELSKTTPRPVSKPSSKQHLTSMPAKSAKDANNRKVVEQKNIEIASAASADASAVVKLPAKQKTAERKPIGRRPKPVSPIKARAPISPSKSTRSTPTASVKSDKDGVIRKVKSDRGTDSSTVSTPSGIEFDSITKQAEKCLTEKSEDMSLDSIESKVLADLKEEREVVEEIEAVLQKAERIEGARRDDHLDGDDDITAEATDRKEDDMTEDDVTADIEELPKKESSRKTSHEMTEEDEYLIIEKEEIYIEDSVQSGEGEHKHLLDAVESETAKTIKDMVTEEDEKYEEEEHVDVSEEKEKADVPEKQLVLDRKNVQETELDEISSGQKEVLEEDLKDIIASATETVHKAEEKDDSGKKDSEDMTKEPSSLSPDKFDSSEKKTTDTDVKPEIEQKDQQVPEKLEESHEKISTLESGATTTAPTLPEDERIPLDDIKEVIDEKHVVDQEKEKECATELKESSAAPATESKPDTKPFEVQTPLRGIQREIVKTPDEVADLPVHEEVDPKLYRMEDFEKVKEEKSSQITAQQQESKEAEAPAAKEQKGVFSFFGKVADKFEKGIDKLTGKSRRESEKDIDEKSSSKSGSPKEIKAQDIFPSDVGDPKMIPTFSTVGEVSKLPEAFEKGQPEVSKIKVATIKDTASFLKEEAEDLQKTTHIDEDWRSRDKQSFGTEAGDILKPVFETCVIKDNTDGLSRTMIELDIEEDAEDVEALLEEASKKFKTVKDSLHDSLESLEEKIAEEDMARIETVTASKDIVKDTLSEVVEKLEDIKPHHQDGLSGTKDEEKIKYDSAEPEHMEIEKSEDLATVTKDLREAVRDVGEVLAGSAGILIEDKPKDVVEIVKKVAEVLKKDDFLSHDVLFDKDAPEEKNEVSDGESKIKEFSIEETEILQNVGVTEKLSGHEKIKEVPGERSTSTPMDSKPVRDLQILEIPCVETIRANDLDITSPVRDSAGDKIEAMKIGANLIEDEDLSIKQKICGSDGSLKPDVMEAGIEAICVKKKQTHPSDDQDPAIEEPNILFDRKISPVIAEVVIVTPDLSPTSPKLKLVKTPVTEAETAHELCESLQIFPDVQNVLRNNAPLDMIIEDLVFTKKLKITMEIIEYIMLIRKLPRDHVIHIIDEVIIRKGLSHSNVIADLKIMSLDAVSPNKREEIERYIEEEYLMKNKQITMQIIQEISTTKFINRRIIIEIIEEILIRKKIPHETVFDISKDEYLQLNLHESETMIERRPGLETSEIIVADDLQQTVPVIRTHSEIKKYIIDELIAKKIKITRQIIDNICVPNKIPRRTCIEIIEELITELNITQSSMFDITERELSELLTSEKEHEDEDEAKSESDKKVVEEELFRADSQALELVVPEKSEIENTIVAEYVLQKKRITPYIFEDICIRYKVSRRIVIEIIEEIIVKQQVERDSILDITDTELSELLSVVEAENEEDELRASSISKGNLIEGVTGDDKLIDGFVDISSKDNILTENIARRESVHPALEESEKDIVDDFEAVEQECKIDSALVTPDKETASKVQTAKTDAKLRDDLEEAIEDDVSDVVEAEEKKTSPPIESLKITKKGSDVADVPEIVDSTGKDSIVTQEKSKVQSSDSVQSSENLIYAVSRTEPAGDDKSLHDSSVNDEITLPSSAVRRMVVTATSEDGGHETEVCSTRNIILTPDDSLKSSPIKITPDQDSIHFDQEPCSGATTPEKDSISDKSIPKTRDGDKITPEDSLDKSPLSTRDSQDLEDSLGKPDLSKVKTIETDTISSITADEKPIAILQPSVLSDVVELKTSVSTVEYDISLVQSEVEQSPTTEPEFTSSSIDLHHATESVETLSHKEKSLREISSEAGMSKVALESSPEDKQTSNATGSQSTPEGDKKEIANASPTAVVIDDKADTKLGIQVLDEKLTQKLDLERSPSKLKSNIISEKSTHDDMESIISDTAKSTKTVEEIISSPSESSGIYGHEMAETSQRLTEQEAIEIDKSEHSSTNEMDDMNKSISEKRSPSPNVGDYPKDIHEQLKHSGVNDDAMLIDDRIGISSAVIRGDEICGSMSFQKIGDAREAHLETLESKSASSDSKQLEDAGSAKKPQVEGILTLTGEQIVSKPTTDGSMPTDGIITDSITPVDTITQTDLELQTIQDSKLDDEGVDKTPSDSILSDKHSVIDDHSGQIITTPTGKSRSPSLIDDNADKRPSSDRFSPSNTIEISPDEKELAAESIELTTLSDKHDEIVTLETAKKSAIPDKSEEVHAEHKAESHSKSPIIGKDEHVDDKAVTSADSMSISDVLSQTSVEKSRSPSPAKDHVDDDIAVDRSRSSSITDTEHRELDHKEPLPSKSLSIAGESENEKQSSDRSGSFSSIGIVDNESCPKYDVAKPTSPAAISDTGSAQGLEIPHTAHIIEGVECESKDAGELGKKDDFRRSRSSSISGDGHSELDDTRYRKSRSPSITELDNDEKQSVEHPVSLGISDRSRSSSIVAEQHDEKSLTDRSRSSSSIVERLDEQPSIDRSRSSSIVVKEQDKKPSIDRSRSSSIVVKEQDEKPSIDQSGSSSIFAEEQDEKPLTDRSRSSSIVTEKLDEKSLADQSRSSSIIAEKQDEQPSIDRPRSSSIVEEQDKKTSMDHSQSSGIVAGKLDDKPLTDRSRSSSIIAEKEDRKPATDQSRSPSIVTEKQDEKPLMDQLQSTGMIADEQDGKPLIDRTGSSSGVAAKQDEESSMDRSRSSSIVAGKLDDKPPTDRSRSSSIIAEKEDVKSSIERTRLSSIVVEKQDDKSSMDRSPSASIVADKLNDKPVIDRSRSSSISAEKEDEKSLTDRSRSPSIVSEKQDEKPLMDGLRSSTMIADEQDEKPSIDRSGSSGDVAAKQDEESSMDRSRSSSIVAEKLDDKPLTDRSRSSSIIAEKEDEKSSIDRTTLSSIVLEKQDKKSSMDRSPSAVIVDDKINDKSMIGRSRSSSITAEKEDGKSLTDRSRSPSIVSEKQDEKPLMDRLRSTTMMTDEKDEKPLIDRSGSSSDVAAKQDEESYMDQSRSSSIVAGKLDDKPPTDQSRSSSIIAEKEDEKSSIDHTTLSSIVLEKQDEKSSMDRSPSAVIVADELNDKPVIDRSRSSSISAEKKDEESLTDRSRSPSIVSEKQGEKPLMDGLQSSTMIADEPDEKPLIDRSGPSSDVAAKQDEKSSVDRSRSSSIVAEKLDDKPLADRSRSTSIIAEKEDEKSSIDCKTLSSIALKKQDEKPSMDQSPSAVVVADKLSDKPVIDRSRSSSISAEKEDEKSATDQSRSPSIVSEKQDEKPLMDRLGTSTMIADEQDEKLSIDRSGSFSDVAVEQHEESSINGLRSSSIVAGKLDDKPLADRSRSSSIIAEKEDEKSSIDRTTLSGIALEEQDEKSSMDRSPSAAIVADELNDKPVIDRSRSSSILAEKEDEKSATDQSRSPSIVSEKQDEKPLMDGLRSSTMIADEQDEKPSRDRSGSSSDVAAKQDEESSMDRSRSSSIVAGKLDDKPLTDRSRSSSIIAEKEDEKSSIEHTRLSSIVFEKEDEKSSMDRALSASIVADKSNDKPVIGRSRSSSISAGKEDEKSLTDRSRSPSIVSDKQDEKPLMEGLRSSTMIADGPDEKPLIDRSGSRSEVAAKQDEESSMDRSRSSSIIAEKEDEKSSLDRTRLSSIVAEKQDAVIVADELNDKPVIDRSRSSSIPAEKEDEKSATDQSRSTSIVSEKQDEKPLMDGLRSSTTITDEQDEKLSLDRSGSSSEVAADQDEKSSMDRSRLSSIVAEKLDDKPQTDRSRSPSIIAEKEDEKSLIDRTTLSSIVLEKQDKKSSMDRSPSAVIVDDKINDKPMIDRSRSSSITTEKEDGKSLTDRSRSPSIVSEKQDEKPSMDQLRSPSIITDEQDGKPLIDRSESSSEVAAMQDEESSMDRSRSSSIVAGKLDDKPLTDRPRSSSIIITENADEESSIDHARLSSIVVEKQDDKSSMDQPPSAVIVVDVFNDKPVIDRSTSSTISAEKEDEKSSRDQSRSPSIASEKQDDKPLMGGLRSSTMIADEQDEKLSINRSESSSDVAAKQDEKTSMDRSRSSSIVAEKLDDKSLTDRSRSSSISAEKEDEKSSIDRTRLSSIVVENQDEKLSMDRSPSTVIVANELNDKPVIDRSRSSSIPAKKEAEKSATDQSRSPSIVSDKQEEKALVDRLRSPSMIADEQDETPSTDRSGSSNEIAAKQDERSSMGRSRSSSIAAEKEDEKSSIDLSRSSSIVVERLDNNLLPGRSRSSSISPERVDEKPSVDRSISSSIVVEKFDDMSTDRSRSSSISAEKQDENTSRLPHISADEQEKRKSLDDSKSMSCSAEKLDAVKPSDHSGLSITPATNISLGIEGEKESIDSSKSFSVATEYQVESEHIQHSRPSSIATERLDGEKSIECLKSSSITTEAHDKTQMTDHSRSSITAGDKQGVTEPIDYSTIGSNQQIKPEPYERSRSSSIAAGEQDEKEVLESTGLSGSPTEEQNEEPSIDHSKTSNVVTERQNGQEQVNLSRSSSIAADEQLEKKPIHHSRSPSITPEKPDVGESLDQTRSSISTTPSISTEIQDYKELIDRSCSTNIAVRDQEEKQPIHHSRSASIASEGYDQEESIMTRTHDKIEPTDHSGSPNIICEKQHRTEPIDYSTITADKEAKTEPIDCSKSSIFPAQKQEDMLPLDQSRSSSITAEKQDEKPLLEPSRSPSIVAETRDDKQLTDRSRSSSIAASDYEKKKPSDGSRSSSIVVEALDTAEPLDCSESAAFLAKTHSEKEQTERCKFSGEAAGQDGKLMSESSPLSNIATELSKDSIDDFNMNAEKLVERQHIDNVTSSSIDAEKPDELKLIARSRSSSIGTEKLHTVESLDHSKSPSIIAEMPEGVEQTDGMEKPVMAAVIDGIELDDHCLIATKNGLDEKLTDLVSSSIIATDVKEPIDRSASDGTGADIQDVEKPNDRIKSASITVETYTVKEQDQHSTLCSTTSVIQHENELADCTRSSSIHSDGHEEKKSIDDSGSSTNDVKNLDRGRDADCLTSSMVGPKTSDDSTSSSIVTEIHKEKDSTDRLRSSSVDAEQLDKEPTCGSTLISSVAEMHGEKEQEEHSRSSSVASEKLAEIEPFRESAIASQKSDTTEPKDHSRIPSIVSELDGKTPTGKQIPRIPCQHDETIDSSGSPSIYGKKSEEPEPIDLSKASAIIDDGSGNGDKSQTPGTVHAQQIDGTLTSIRKDSISSATMVEDSDLDKKDTVEALQTLAETIADASAEMKYDRNLPASEEDQQMTDTLIDRSRSHSLFDADKRTPMNRSRTASLYEDKVPEVLSLLDEVKTGLQGPATTNIYAESDQATITTDDVSKKSSTQEVEDGKIDLSSDSKLTKSEDTTSEALILPIKEYTAEQFEDQHHTSAEEIAKVKEHIINRYIINKEKITLRIVEEIGMLYSMPTNMVFKLIEAIIIDNDMSRNAVIDFLEDDEAGIRAVMSEDSNVDIISIPLSKRNDIETYIQGEFITKNKKISSTIINEIAATKSTSRRIIIMIINEMIVDRNLSRAGLIERGVLSPESSPENDLDHSEPESITRERSTLDDRQIQKDNFASISTGFESQVSLPNKEEPQVSEQQRVEIETYVMEECVKKGRKITVLVFEQIMTTMNVSRSVLLNIIENIIVTRKMSRRGMVDDAIYDEVVSEMCKPSDYQFTEATEKTASELVQTKERLVELSGKSTPDPKSSGYSTPEARQYDDKFGKEMSSYSTDYESPFHKAFVGGMTEIRTTHITTLSGKSTPDYSVRGDTPESVSDSMGKSSQAKFEGEFPVAKVMTSQKCNEESSKTLQQIPSMLTTHITTSTTAATILDSPTRHMDIIPDDTSGTIKITSHEIYEEEKPVLMKKIVSKDLIREEDPIIIRKVIKKEIIEEQPETITTVIRRTIIDTSDETVNDGTISQSFQQGSPETIEKLTVATSEVVVPTVIDHCDHSKIQAVSENIISGSEYMDGTKEFSSEEPLNQDVEKIITTVTTITVPEHEPDTTTISDAVMSKTCTRTEVVGAVEETKPSESSNIKENVIETTKPSPLAYGHSSDSDSSLRIGDSALADDDCESHSKVHSEKIIKKQEHPTPLITKNLKSDSTEKSTPDLPISSLIRDGTSGHHQIFGRSTPDKRPVSRTATPEALRSNEVIRTTITTTRTMSEEGDIITTTMEITETTNEKGETTILAEKTDVKVEDRILATDAGKSSFSSGFEAVKGSIDSSSAMDTEPISPRSDHSSLHSRAGTHVWESSEERHTYSDEEVPGSPLSTTSQVGYSPQSTYHFGEHSFGKGSSHKSMEFSEADMSSSFYGELPELPPRVTTMKTAYIESSSAETSGTIAPPDADFSFKKFTVEKESAGKSSREQTSCKLSSDDGDLDCEKSSMERNGIKKDKELPAMAESRSPSGSLSSTSLIDTSKEPVDIKKDPLADWDPPLGLPSPKPPRKFNLRTIAKYNNSDDTSPESINLDVINDWGEPLRLPSPAGVSDEASNKGTPSTPKRERKQQKKIVSENIKNRKLSESPTKTEKKSKDSKSKIQPVYMDLTYVPHHGNSYYTSIEFFKRVRARYYVFSGTEPSREVYDALLDAKKTWEDKDLEVTMIPTYDTDTLGYWVADNEEALAANHIDLSPSASRCTINLQDHETSCSAYRLEF